MTLFLFVILSGFAYPVFGLAGSVGVFVIWWGGIAVYVAVRRVQEHRGAAAMTDEERDAATTAAIVSLQSLMAETDGNQPPNGASSTPEGGHLCRSGGHDR